jgi:methylated-DNA-[protein]-cysteine S-methyltransferase
VSTYTTTVGSPLGPLVLCGDGTSLAALRLPDHPGGPVVPADAVADDAPFAEVAAQLEAYFAGERTAFDLPLAPAGTAFQRAVWSALAEIPYGTTTTYGALAARLGRPRAVRAVGLANGRNPLPIVLPCHRVVGADGTLTGYAGGLAAKGLLLDLESAAARLPLPAAAG